MKHKRVFTDEQRQAASERMKKMSLERWAQKRMESTAVIDIDGAVVAPPLKVVAPVIAPVIAPEVQAVIDTMDPQRRAKLESIQARTLAVLAQTQEGREAIERSHSPAQVLDQTPVAETPEEIRDVPPPISTFRDIPMKVPFRLTGSQSGMMISELGPCWCGESKLKWHPVCLKVKVHG